LNIDQKTYTATRRSSCEIVL